MKRSHARSAESIQFAKSQRQTANEFADHVWQWIRNRQCCKAKFRREVPIPPYAVDFCCIDWKLVIEVDGESHKTEEGKRKDQERDRYLASLGYQVLRIPGYEVIRNGRGVIERIHSFVQTAIDSKSIAPHPQPFSPEDRGEGSQSHE